MRWGWLVSGITLAFVLHFFLSILCIAISGERANASSFTLGKRSVVLASIWRRSIAKWIDVSLFYGTLCLFLYFGFADLVNTGDDLDTVRFANDLNDQETTFLDVYSLTQLAIWFPYEETLQSILLMSAEFPEVFLVSMFAFGAISALYFFAQSRYGITPGKWVCGIRTVRTTLRPPGIARLIAREVLLWIDVPFLLSPVPAVISMFFSEQRQRLGDRLADTVVILRKSGEFDSY
jgi:uncharacterized RDD family membrane protein YckC